jgi:hypothetical protein
MKSLVEEMEADFILCVVQALNTELVMIFSSGGLETMALKSILLLVGEASPDCKSNGKNLYHFVDPVSW